MIDNRQCKIDLHTHSIISYDGGIRTQEYEKILSSELLDCIAITDHNDISLAKELHKKFGTKIIVGEEIMTKDGEVIGLFLSQAITPHMSITETVAEIKQQDGLVYIPHPFEKRRKGLHEKDLEKIISDIDIVEIFNARAFFDNKSETSYNFAVKNSLAMAASSDAHGIRGLGSSFTRISDIPTRQTLVRLLSAGSVERKHAPAYSLFYPTINKIKHNMLRNS